MQLKTPKFNEALEKYFSKLELDEQVPPGTGSVRAGGQERTCRLSGKKFYIRPEDIEFYKKIRVPLPTLSPHERARRKLGFFNLVNLFFTKSAKTGKKIVSSYPPNTLYKIYEHKIWNDTDFTNLDRKYDFERKFFEQYKNFQLLIPRPSLEIKNTVNSDFGNAVNRAKNCYLTSDVRNSEDSSFCEYIQDAKNSYHSFGIINTDICYDSTMIDDSYKIFFSELSKNCLDSSFLFDCRNCSDCFMCTNLRHKKYCFENRQFLRTEYQEKMARVNLGSIDEISKWKEKFIELKKKAVHKANHNEKNMNCNGDYINSSKDCYFSFYISEGEKCNYSIGSYKQRDIYDVIGGHGSELSYEALLYLGSDNYGIKFSGKVDNMNDSEYCDLCYNCSNCFACIGLKNKKFCIFNKQYSEKDYWKKIDEIKTKMLMDGEYGEFFPPALAPIPYNVSVATSYGGYDDIVTAKKYGYKVEKIPDNIQGITSKEILVSEIPDDIKDVTDDILQKTIIDKKNNKKFRYTKEELEFHRKYNLALPTEHYSIILARKRISLGPIDFNIKYRNCFKCKKEAQVTFPEDHPDAPKKVYCEKCYNQEIH